MDGLNGFACGGLVETRLAKITPTGLSDETAEHKALQRKLPLSAPVSATVVVQQMIRWTSRRNAICTSLIPWDPNLWGSACHVHGLGSWELRGALTHLRYKKRKKPNMAERQKTQQSRGGFTFFFF